MLKGVRQRHASGNDLVAFVIYEGEEDADAVAFVGCLLLRS